MRKHPRFACARARVAWFRRRQDGSATVEAVLWVPAFFGLLCLVVDTSMIFNGQARMFRIVQDANRALSVGRLSSTIAEEDSIKAAVASMTKNPVVKTTITSGVITTTLSIPAKDLDIVGWYSTLANATVTVKSQHFVEY